MFSFEKRPDENQWQYKWRIYKAKTAGEINMDWTELGERIDAVLRPDEPQFSESVYRKEAALVTKYYENVFAKQQSSIDLKSDIDELYKVKRLVADQRREYNKLLVADARAEHLNECLVQIAKDMNEKHPIIVPHEASNGGSREAVLFVSDVHYGMVTDNIWNKYNTDICKERLGVLTSKAMDVCHIQGIRKLHVVLLGDLAHGAIHCRCRVSSEEDAVEQLMHVSELVAQMIAHLASVVDEVDVHSTYGNHMRTVQNKKESVHSDNMERIVPWWLRQRLVGEENVTIIDSPYYEFIKLDVLGWKVVATHGDLDNPRDFGIMVNSIFSRVYGETIDYGIIGDKHHKEIFDRMGIDSYLVSSLCGTDDHANDMRLYSEPSQTMMIFNRIDGQECIYNIKVKN